MRKTFSFILFLLVTVPALGQWQSVSSPIPTSIPLYLTKIQAVDTQRAWFSNSTYTNSWLTVPFQISRTIDGGQTWQNVGPPFPLNAVYTSGVLEAALDAQNAWAVMHRVDAGGGNPTLQLHYTADGGATWSLRAMPTVTQRLGMLHFFNLSEGVVLDQRSGALYRTTDGGVSWQLQNTAPTLTTNQSLDGMREAGGILWTTVYGVQAQPVAFWASTDRGLTWRSQTLPGASGAVVFRDTQNALLPTTQGGMLSTNDGGVTWQNATAPPFRLGPLTAIPGTRTYVAGAEHWIGIPGAKGSAVTYDDGQTWIILESANSYQSIEFSTSNAGWSVLASFAPPTVNHEYEGISRYVGSPLATRNTSATSVTADVFPNPSTSGIFTVRLPATAGSVSAVRVLDALGRVVYRAASLPADQLLNLSQQSKGVYSLEVQTNTGVVRRKLLVE